MKSKKIIIAIVAILVVLGGTFAGLWFFTDVFNFLKPANDVFSNQLEKALNVEGVKFSNYSDYLKEYKETVNKPYTSKINMTADLQISELEDDVQEIINNSKITLEQNADITNKKMQNKIGLYSKNSEVLTLDLITDNNKIGVGSKDLYDKYLTASLEDIVKLSGKQSGLDDKEVEQLLNSLSGSNIDPYELLYISDEDLKHFDETYRNCLTTFISKDCYTSEKNVEVEVNGEDVKTTAYYLTLTGKDAYNFVKELTKTIQEDEVIVKLITNKVNLVLQGSTEEKISEDDVKELINELVESINTEIEEIKDEDKSAIQFAIYSNKSQPVRIEFNVLEDVEELDEKETVFTVEYSKEDDTNKDIYTLYQDGKAAMNLVNEYTKKSDEEISGKFTLKASGADLGTLSYEIVSKDDESKVVLDLNVPLASLSANITITSEGNYKKEEVKFAANMSFKYGKESAKLNIDGTIDYTKNVSIPELTSSNSVDVLKLNETEMQKVLMEILTKASEVLPSRLKLIGVEIDSEDILPTAVEENTETTEGETPTEENTETNVEAEPAA